MNEISEIQRWAAEYHQREVHAMKAFYQKEEELSLKHKAVEVAKATALIALGAILMARVIT